MKKIKKSQISKTLDAWMVEPMSKTIGSLITASSMDYHFIIRYVLDKRIQNKAILSRIKQAKKINGAK